MDGLSLIFAESPAGQKSALLPLHQAGVFLPLPNVYQLISLIYSSKLSKDQFRQYVSDAKKKALKLIHKAKLRWQ